MKEINSILKFNNYVVNEIRFKNNEIFKDAEKNNYPFEMTVSLTGKFECEGEEPEKFSKNAIAILYPYVRAIVSTYTANANVNALILPAINVNKLIEEDEKN